MYMYIYVSIIVYVDPVNVIGLYPGLLPSDLRNQISQHLPTKPPVLSMEDLAEAMKHLITYLTQVQLELSRAHTV